VIDVETLPMNDYEQFMDKDAFSKVEADHSTLNGYLLAREVLETRCLDGAPNWTEFLAEFQAGFVSLLHHLTGTSASDTPQERPGEPIASPSFQAGYLQGQRARIDHLTVHTSAIGEATLPSSMAAPDFFSTLRLLFERMQESDELKDREDAFQQYAQKQTGLDNDIEDVVRRSVEGTMRKRLLEAVEKEEDGEAAFRETAALRQTMYQKEAQNLSNWLSKRLFDIGEQFSPWYAKHYGLRPLRPITTLIPARQAQQTNQMTRTMNVALGDAPKMNRWQVVEGEIALRHVIPEWPLQTLLKAGQALSWWGRPESTEALQEELKQLGIDSVFLANVLTGLSLQEGQVTIAMDEMIRALGRGPEARRGPAYRARVEREVWRSVLIFDALAIVGIPIGRYKSRDTKQVVDVGLSGVEAIIKITSITPGQVSSDGSAPPAYFSYVCGPWIERMRGNRQILTDFGDVMRLARIPAGKPSGAWAKSIGLNLNQRWREWSHDAEIAHVGDTNKLTARFPRDFTRRDLLGGKELYRAIPDAEDILNSTNPSRAQEYWEQAITILRERDGASLIGHYAERGPAVAFRTKGWKEAWLDQPLDIRPNRESMKDVAELASARKRARPTKPKTAH